MFKFRKKNIVSVIMFTGIIAPNMGRKKGLNVQDFDKSIAFKASVDLVLEGDISPSGYTEPILHKSRLQLKSMPD